MVKWEIKVIEKILEDCGNIAQNYYNAPGFELKSDNSIVTKADKAVEDFLTSVFNSPKNGSYIIGEETVIQKDDEYINKALQNTAWIVDPIDGTAPYSHHIPTWGISIAFTQNGIIKEGAVFLPEIGEMYLTENGKIYYKKRIIQNNICEYTSLTKLTPHRQNMDTSLISITQETTKEKCLSFCNPVQSICCAVFSLTQLLQHRYMGYILSDSIKIWDFSAGLLFLKLSNITVNFISGEPLSLNIRELCNINKNGIDRWKLKSEAVAAISDEAYRFVLSNITSK